MKTHELSHRDPEGKKRLDCEDFKARVGERGTKKRPSSDFLHQPRPLQWRGTPPKSLTRDEKARSQKIIQGLYEPNQADGPFWYLVARVLLSKYVERR